MATNEDKEQNHRILELEKSEIRQQATVSYLRESLDKLVTVTEALTTKFNDLDKTRVRVWAIITTILVLVQLASKYLP